MKAFTCLLFWAIISLSFSQITDTEQDEDYFTYSHDGLIPSELIIYKDSLSAGDIYLNVKKALMFAIEVLPDFSGKIIDEKAHQSFTLKGKFLSAFCHDSLLGKFCSDAIIEIDFVFSDGSYVMRPTKIRRAVDIEKIPISGRAFFYKKDNTLKKKFSSYPSSIERMLNWLAIFSGLVETTDIIDEK